MNPLNWKTIAFQKFSTEQLFDVLQLRVDVFVVEQRCAYRELDEYDRHAEVRHLSGRNEAGELIAYSRLLPPGLRYPEVNLGRFVVRADSRKQGIGHQLLQTALREISGCWPAMPIRISAQDYLQGFYVQYGFSRVSDVYLEDGIPHVEMVKEV
ncbi:MAG: GNAT family N-acetyltransferase [Nitrospirota bacterium]|nr:GNAT family N-acetyltransferase [Nitrospirota bacterium]